MRRLLNYIVVMVLVGLVFCACKKDTMRFSSDDTVYFSVDSTVYTFVDKKANVTQDTVLITVNLLGKLLDKDRQVDVAVDSGNAVPGKDFQILQPVTLMKDSNNVQLQVVLFRTADLKTESKTAFISLRNSKDIAVADYPGHVQHELRFSDMVIKPDWWDGYFFQWNFSVTRMKFYIDVTGSTKSPSTSGVGLDFPVVIYMLRAATAQYNQTHSTPLSDEYGPITWDVDWLN